MEDTDFVIPMEPEDQPGKACLPLTTQEPGKRSADTPVPGGSMPGIHADERGVAVVNESMDITAAGTRDRDLDHQKGSKPDAA